MSNASTLEKFKKALFTKAQAINNMTGTKPVSNSQ